jgi:hypothetical protein
MKALRLLIAGLTASAALSATPADAGRRRAPVAADGYVTAESRFGHGSVTGAVRETSVGPQVQLPSGSWVYCRRSCSETLRVETVDRFENPGENFGATTLQAECGIFGCLDVR